MSKSSVTYSFSLVNLVMIIQCLYIALCLTDVFVQKVICWFEACFCQVLCYIIVCCFYFYPFFLRGKKILSVDKARLRRTKLRIHIPHIEQTRYGLREKLCIQTSWMICLQVKSIVQIITNSLTECQIMNTVVVTTVYRQYQIPVSKIF
jgi:hypothetical protein